MIKPEDLTQEELEKIIPKGIYCYNYVNDFHYVCPFWSLVERGTGKETYREGWCLLLKETDLLLDDCCKLCDINDQLEEDEK